MSPATRRTCLVEGCKFREDGSPYITQEGLGTQDAVLKYLELHLKMVHENLGGSGNQTRRAESNDARPDRFPRPEIQTQQQKRSGIISLSPGRRTKEQLTCMVRTYAINYGIVLVNPLRRNCLIWVSERHNRNLTY